MKALFSKAIHPADPRYIALRDEPRHAELKEYCRHLWNVYHPHADPHFPQEFACNLHARFWELYLGAYLLQIGIELAPRKSSDGPDFQFEADGRRVWIEATAPGEGEGRDAVPTLSEHEGFEPVPEEKIILRFTNAISEKRKKFEQYISSGVVDSDDILLIAVNGGAIELIMGDEPLPTIVKSVYPFGEYVVSINRKTSQIVREGFRKRYSITKDSGAEVPTSAFLDQKFSAIGGVLYSGAALWNLPPNPSQELLLIHNYSTSTSVEAGWFNIEYEYSWGGEGLLVKRN